jgi:hypothetical protein
MNNAATAQQEPDKVVGIRFDDLTIQREAEHLPEDLREDFTWLKCFLREECSRDLDVFMLRARKLNIPHDRTTWSKIFRGRYNRDQVGRPLPNPIISVESFRQHVTALRTNTRAEQLRGKVPFCDTSVAVEIFDYCDLKRSPDRVNRFGIIVGATGSGKTAAFKEYVRRNNHGATRWVEAPFNGSTIDLVTSLAVSGGYGAQNPFEKKRRFLVDSLDESKLLIIDNAQDLYKIQANDQPAFTFLRTLQDTTGCAIVLSITPIFEQRLRVEMIRGYWEQFEGRSGGRRNWLRLPEYPPDDDCVMIAKTFGVVDAGKYRKELASIAREPGRIRYYFEVLQTAKQLASAGKTDLTIDVVRDAIGEE